MHKLNFILLFFLCLASVNIFAEDSKCHRSTEGKEFWFGFMEGRNNNGNVHYIEITVTAREATSFSVYIGKSTTPLPVTNFVAANNSTQIRMPLNLAEATGSETIQDRGIHLVAEKPVNVYALNWDRNSADLAVMYPVESLGNEYFTMCYSPNVHNNPAHGRNSEFLIVASKDSTTVEIVPSVVTDKGKEAKIPFFITLHKGEVYQVQSLNQKDPTGRQGDLTGSYIKSDKPVAVYSGNFSTTIPVETGMGGYDHLYEQIPPVQTWGREYYAVPLLSRRADRYRVMASEDNTTILIGTRPPIKLDRGNYHEFILLSDEPARIYSDNPIMIAQFSQSNKTDEQYTGGDGDPFMIILSSVSQTKNDVTFVAYNSSQITNYYINVVVRTIDKDGMELDGVMIGEFFEEFKGSDYSYAQLKIYSGTHNIKNLNPERGFLAYVYGYGGFESYGYGVGFNLDLVLDLGQSINYQGDTLIRCFGDTIVLDAGPYFDNYIWNTGDSTQKIIVTKQGRYWAVGTTVDGCKREDSIFIFLSETKKPDIGPDRIGCEPFSVKLDAGEYAGYIWSTGSTERIIEVNETNTYSVATYDKYGCPTSDTMELTVFAVPSVNMVGNKITCGIKTRKLELEYTGADETMLANGTIIWNTDQPDKLKITNKTNTSSDISVSEWGIYTVSFTFTTPDNCIVSDSYTLRFAEIPTSKIEFVDDPNDKCKGYSREIIYKGNATQNANYFWDYGNSLADSIDWNKRRVSVAAGNAKSIISLYVEENGCWSTDTSTLTMAANPDFMLNTAKSRGCDSATVQFSGELKVKDNLLFEWDFGDENLVSGIQNPIHHYSDTGKFNVTLKITNLDNQCFVGYTIEEMVKIFPTPVAKIVVDPEFCNDKKVDVHYLQNIDSSFCTWDFDGTAHLIGGENDSITIFLDNQIATIRLQVEEYGCTSKWVETTATRKPFFDFTTDITEGCQPLQVLATATTADEQLEFSWLTDSIVTFENEQLIILPDAGDYGFSLSAKSGITGCSDTLSKEEVVRVHPKPFAKFDVDYPVAIIEHATLQFTNLSLDVDIFNWDFADGSSSTEKNPQHTFTAINKYPVELIVESEFGCIDTTMMEIEVLPFNVYTPNAFRPDSEIPENREFMPVGVGVDPNVFHLQIFNRWGELVFESTNPEYKWNGNIKNSNPAPMGNYIWKVEFADIQGFQHSMKGQIMLIR